MEEKVAETLEESRPKVVTWQLEKRSNPKLPEDGVRNRENLSRRDQPTWYNCRMSLDHARRHNDNKHPSKPRVMSAPASSYTSSRSAVTSLWNGGATTEMEGRWERGRELLRRRARLQLRKILPTKFEKFDSSDLLQQEKKKMRCKSAPLDTPTFSGNASLAVAPKGDPYFINGVRSSAYRRPSVQLGRRESDELSVAGNTAPRRRYSEPTVRFVEDERSTMSVRRQSDAQFSAASFSRAPSTSAPATVASNDASVKSKALKERPPYLEHDWRSEILSRYATEEPWVPRIKTTRYFPKFANLQDVNCRNPYLIPNGLLYNAT